MVTGFGTDEQIRSVVEECIKRGSPKVEYCPADLSELNHIETMFENIKEKFGRGPDVLVNNAGKQCILLACSLCQNHMTKNGSGSLAFVYNKPTLYILTGNMSLILDL